MEKKKNTRKSIPRPTNFGANLKVLRRLRGLSQTELSELCGLNRNNIASYEAGQVEPSAANFLKICSALDVDPAAMLEATISDKYSKAESLDGESTFPSQHLLTKIGDFAKQNNEMSKVLEGYTTLLEMRDMTGEYDKHPALYGTLKDLVELLATLVRSNKGFSQKIHPDSEEE